jgi:hypothetical protein
MFIISYLLVFIRTTIKSSSGLIDLTVCSAISTKSLKRLANKNVLLLSRVVKTGWRFSWVMIRPDTPGCVDIRLIIALKSSPKSLKSSYLIRIFLKNLPLVLFETLYITSIQECWSRILEWFDVYEILPRFLTFFDVKIHSYSDSATEQSKA